MKSALRADLWMQILFVTVCASSLLAATRPKNVIVRDAVRFEVLSPDLIRLEYSHGGQFVDAPSVAVQNRNFAIPDVHTSDSDGWVEVSSEKMRLRYRSGSGAFGADNIVISWSDEGGEHQWKPGDKDDKNLGGIPGDIARRAIAGSEMGPLSRNGYFLLDDSHTALRDGSNGWVRPRSDDGAQDWYFFVYGRDYKSLLRELTELLGPIPMIPRYALGTWFGSRAGYSSDEWIRIIDQFRDEHVPLDMLVLDSYSVLAHDWTICDWDPEQMPDLGAFFRNAKDRGVKVTVNEHYSTPLTPNNCGKFGLLRDAIKLPADTKEISYDLADKKTADAFMNILHKPPLDAGMAFWWQDGNALARMKGLDSTLWTRDVEYNSSERYTGRRALMFGRLTTPPWLWAGYPAVAAPPAWGIHRYGVFFTGDLMPHWSTLDLLIPFNVQASNMLIDYPNSLTAGVFKSVIDSELYQRWMQFSALSPVFWWHGIWGLRTPWEYSPDDLDATRKFLKLRYSLIPYMYTYGRLAHDDGQPLVRGTYIEYPAQDGAYEFHHQYLLGKELLIAPISEPGYGRPVLKEIYLPAGEQWFDFFTGRIYEGGQVIGYECPLNRMPIFVKAGSILPLAPEMDYSDQHPVDPLTLEVFAGKPASFRLYEDDGDSLDYRKGGYAWTQLTYEPSQRAGEHTITIGPVEGHYQGQILKRRYRIRIHGLLKPESVRVGTQLLAEEQSGTSGERWSWNYQERVTTIDLPVGAPIQSRIVVSLNGGGSFETESSLERLVDYRSRVRRVEADEKLKWGLILGLRGIRKEPRVLRETEQVEQEIIDLAKDPRQLARNVPDYKSWTARILAAFVNQPFDSNRTIPDINPDTQNVANQIANAVFTSEEISHMTADLLGCRLAANARNASASETGPPDYDNYKIRPTVIGRLDYDAGSVPDAHVSYEIQLPPNSLPGWGEISRSIDNHDFTHFLLQSPFPPQPGPHTIQLKAILRWSGGQTEVTRNVEWENSIQITNDAGLNQPRSGDDDNVPNQN